MFIWGLALFVCLPGVSFADQPPGIVVWKLQGNKGVSEEDVNLLSNFVTNQVAKYSGSKVISEADIHTILKGEETRQQCGAGDTSCVAEIGNALGVPEAVSGDIGKIGSFWMLNLRRINVRSAEVIARSSRQIEGRIDDLLLSIPPVVAELFGIKLSDQQGMLLVSSEPIGAMVSIDDKQATTTPFKQRLPEGSYKVEISRDGYFPEKQTIELKPGDRKSLSVKLKSIPMNPYKQAAYGTFFPGLGLVALGGIATWQAKEARNDYNYSGSSGDQSRSQSWAGAAIAGYTIGGAAMITGVVLWILDPGNLEWAEQHHVSVAPAPDGRGLAVSFSRRW